MTSPEENPYAAPAEQTSTSMHAPDGEPSAESKQPRIRPLRVALGVGGVLGALLVALLVGTALVTVTPRVTEAYKMSRPAPEPSQPSADPAAVAAQEELNAAGGARWEGEVRIGGRVVQSYEGSFDSSKGCDSSSVSTYHPREAENEAAGFQDEIVVKGGRAAGRMDPAEPWQERDPFMQGNAPIFLDIVAPARVCEVVASLGRSTEGMSEQAVEGLPEVVAGGRRYAGAPTKERISDLNYYETFQELKKYRRPTVGDSKMVEADFSGAAAKMTTVVLDVDSQGRPNALWLLGKGRDTMDVRMSFTQYGPQTVEFPEKVTPAEEYDPFAEMDEYLDEQGK